MYSSQPFVCFLQKKYTVEFQFLTPPREIKLFLIQGIGSSRNRGKTAAVFNWGKGKQLLVWVIGRLEKSSSLRNQDYSVPSCSSTMLSYSDYIILSCDSSCFHKCWPVSKAIDNDCVRQSGLMVGALDSRLRGLGSSTGQQDHCVVLFRKTFSLISASLHPHV